MYGESPFKKAIDFTQMLFVFAVAGWIILLFIYCIVMLYNGLLHNTWPPQEEILRIINILPLFK